MKQEPRISFADFIPEQTHGEFGGRRSSTQPTLEGKSKGHKAQEMLGFSLSAESPGAPTADDTCQAMSAEVFITNTQNSYGNYRSFTLKPPGSK